MKSKEALDAIKEQGTKGMSVFELSNHLNISIDDASLAINELYDSNMIKDIGYRKNLLTGHNGLIWIDAACTYEK